VDSAGRFSLKNSGERMYMTTEALGGYLVGLLIGLHSSPRVAVSPERLPNLAASRSWSAGDL
jgi:hypothetical protein